MKAKLLYLIFLLLFSTGLISQNVWLTGLAFGEWKESGVIKMTNNGGGIFTATNILIAGNGGVNSQFKFTEGTWTTASGRSLTTPAPGFPTGVTELSAVTEVNGVDNVITGTPGYWNVAYNYNTKAYSFTPTPNNNWGVVGSATPNGWNGPDMPLSYDAISNQWSGVVSLNNGYIKFRNNNNWNFNYGDNGVDGSLDQNGADIAINKGRYLITLDFNTFNYSIIPTLIAIPDPNFEQALIAKGLDTNGSSGNILESDSEAIIDLDINNKNISSLSGIEKFVNLRYLYCNGNLLTELNLGNNPNLINLHCGNNALTTIDVTKYLNLASLHIYLNKLTALDVSQNPNLEELLCSSNKLTAMDISGNSKLKFMNFADNKLVNLNIANGNNANFSPPGWANFSFDARYNPALNCIKVDAGIINSIPSDWFKDTTTSYSKDSCQSLAVIYVNDSSTADDVFTTTVGIDTNPGTAALPFATIQQAINRATVGSQIFVDTGTYTEQITITKGTTITGAGQDLTSILKPAVTFAPSGSFTEQGVIQTTQSITGDVHISNLSVTGDFTANITPIIIQSGGSVKNCKLQNGNQGVFVRVDPAINLAGKAFVVDGNTINAEYIAVNFAGTRLSATLINNTIATFNPGFSTGVFAGLEFGTLNDLTVTGNTFSSYANDGLMVNTNNGNISQNSFIGIGQKAINKIGGSTINASCNWYGTANAATVSSKITDGVAYSPWLVDGTDDSAVTGFQTSAICPDANSFYVNDNSQSGDIFTTAIGNNANSGTSTSPYATVEYAISQVPIGATIYVDAGTYIENVIINKSVVLRGAKYGQNPGSSLNRGNESIIIPFYNLGGLNGNAILLKTTANDITIDGFTIDGDNPATTGGQLVNGIDCNAGVAIFNDNVFISNLTIINNIVKNTSAYGIGQFKALGNQTAPAVTGALFRNNRVNNIGSRGIVLGYNAYGAIENNYITNVNNSGIWIANHTLANPSGLPVRVSGNIVSANNLGIQLSSVSGSSPRVEVFNNEVIIPATGYGLSLISNSSGASFTNNKVVGGVASVLTNTSLALTPITFNNNSFTGYVTKIFETNTGTVQINAGCNWYGSSAVQDFYTKFNTTYVSFITWLTNGTDNDIATGFQPVPGSCDGYPTLITLNSSTNVTCNGAANGTINVTTSYGKAPFTYTWTKDGDATIVSNNEDPIGLAPGTYRLAILDGNGSNIYITDPEADDPGTIVVTITEPSLLTATTDGTNNLCNGQLLGTASVTPDGGTSPYTFLWNNAATTQNISNLAAGIYTVTVTDANGCTKITSYEVTQPSVLTASANGTNVSCFNGTDGSATANPNGGTTPYSYSWSNGDSSQTISNLTSGTYTVNVTDSNGCTATATYQITEPTLLTVSMTGTVASCNGSTTATPAGGTSPYSYLWSNGSTSQTISNVPAGTYTVTVKDANDCTVTGSFTIIGNSNINPNTSLINVSCFGGNNASITVTSAGGTAPLTYNLNGSVFQSSNVFSNLVAGVYVVGVKDANGCSDFVTRTITQPALLTVTTSSIQSACFGQNNGAISITVIGGSGAKTYSWSGPNGYTSAVKNPSNLLAGNYSLLVTDAKGCTVLLNVVVPTFNAITVSETITNILCRGSLTGAINLTVSGGSGSGFTYSWTGSTTSTSEDISNVGPGNNYKVTITDTGSGCTVTKTYIISQPASNLAISTTKTNATGCNSLGTITVTGSGGTAGYTYSIDGTNYQVTNTFSGLQAGSYTAWVKDTNGCTKSSAIISITDNGSDAYESNNSKNQAKLIPIGTTINARIATAVDVADWFKFTTPPTGNGNYQLSITHQSINYTFNMYPSANNAAALVPTSSTSTSKTFTLTGGLTYFVQITGASSYSCYDLSIAPPPSFAKEVVSTTSKAIEITEINNLSVKAYPNPHQGSFNLSINSPTNEKATIQLFNILGQLLTKKEVNITEGQNIIEFNEVRPGIILYNITIGNQVVNGKVLGKE